MCMYSFLKMIMLLVTIIIDYFNKCLSRNVSIGFSLPGFFGIYYEIKPNNKNAKNRQKRARKIYFFLKTHSLRMIYGFFLGRTNFNTLR